MTMSTTAITAAGTITAAGPMAAAGTIVAVGTITAVVKVMNAPTTTELVTHVVEFAHPVLSC